MGTASSASELQAILDRTIQVIQAHNWGTAPLVLQDNAAPTTPDTDQQADDALAFPLQVGDQKFGWLVADLPADEQPPPSFKGRFLIVIRVLNGLASPPPALLAPSETGAGAPYGEGLGRPMHRPSKPPLVKNLPL
jgi:hypothetical protein